MQSLQGPSKLPSYDDVVLAIKTIRLLLPGLIGGYFNNPTDNGHVIPGYFGRYFQIVAMGTEGRQKAMTAFSGMGMPYQFEYLTSSFAIPYDEETTPSHCLNQPKAYSTDNG